MTFSEWMHGPLEDHAIVFGLQVFWLKRLFSTLQLISGLSVLVDLFTRHQKQTFYAWVLRLRGHSVPGLLGDYSSVKSIIVGIISALVFLSSLTVSIIYMSTPKQGGHSNYDSMPNIFVLFVFSVIVAMGVALFTTLILDGVHLLATIAGFSMFRVLPIASPLLAPSRLKITVTIASLLAFVFSSVALILLS